MNIDFTITKFIRSAIHIILFSMWCVSLQRRIIQQQTKKNLICISSLMIFWVILKTLKYFIITDAVIDRYIWYMYYAPLLFIPLFGLFIAFSVGKSVDFKLPEWTYLFYIPTVLLFVLVMTNDLHQLVFRFPENSAVWTDHEYEYGLFYWLMMGWEILCTLIMLVTLFIKCRIPGKTKFFILPLIPIGAMLMYQLLYVLEVPSLRFIAGDMSITCSLLYIAILESFIKCRLIPTNSQYDELFGALVNISAKIVDENYKVRYSSDNSDPVSEELMRKAETEPVTLSEGRQLHNMSITGGHVIWTEDISELLFLRRELKELQEELKDRNALLKLEYEHEKERQVIEEQNRMYDILVKTTQKQIDRISLLVKKYGKAGKDTYTANIILAEIAVLSSFVKRRKHLALSEYSDYQIPEEELICAFRESVNTLKLMNVMSNMFIDTERKYLSGKTATLAYDFFEDSIELAMDSLRSVMASIGVINDKLRIRVTVDCDNDMNTLKKSYSDVQITYEDEWVLVLELEGDAAI
ncbi:MAG: histidine kinase N-terminal 7TM domain-containing protein [Ruminococcus sp.]